MKEKFLLRVMSGKYRGKGISSPKSEDDVRPTAGRIKQSVFNILRFELADKIFLDMFAGSGQMGIEAVSCGAKKSIFFDRDAILAKQNASRILQESEFEVFRGDSFELLKALKGNFPDIVFADPPYSLGMYERIIMEVTALLPENGVLILEHPTEFSFEGDRRVYGKKALTFIRGAK